MAQTAITIRVDQDLKNNFDTLCEDFGLSITSAFTIFMKAVVRERKIPFEIQSKNMEQRNFFMDNIMSIRETAKEYGLLDMKLDEINEEIKAVRENR